MAAVLLKLRYDQDTVIAGRYSVHVHVVDCQTAGYSVIDFSCFMKYDCTRKTRFHVYHIHIQPIGMHMHVTRFSP